MGFIIHKDTMSIICIYTRHGRISLTEDHFPLSNMKKVDILVKL